ncbi:DUF397 domain-containing protein [Streptomyces sp. DT117]|uniref:DUF397 domain-containing protein n=1 Tax=Streptomyces sp. DT117 TaxID=3393422 RepID=UPI003CEA7836
MNAKAVLAGASWFTSSYSNDQGGACVEGARLHGSVMAVRDSKDREGSVFVFPATTWDTFVDAVKKGTLA